VNWAPLLLSEGDAALIGQADQALLRARRKVHDIARSPSAELLDGLMQDLDDIAPGIVVARGLCAAAMAQARAQGQ